MKQLYINPVYKKELKTSVRSMKIALTLLAYNGLLALIGLISFYALFESARYNGMDHGLILMIYAILVVMEFGLILFVIPAYTSSAISGERERQTLEILLTTSMKPSQIIRGKLFSSISTVLLLVFSSLPVLSLVFSIGGVSFGDLMKYVLLVLGTAVYAGSFGLLFSVIFKKTTISTVFTYGMLVVIGIGTVVLLLIVYVLMDQYYTTQSFHGGSYQEPDLGYGVCLLLFNPGVSIGALLFGQFGSMGEFGRAITSIGTVPKFLTEHWFLISLVVQTVTAVLLLSLAATLLNPLKRNDGKRARKDKKRKKKKE